MSRIAYVNGRYVHHREAAVHVEDRGYQFADGVYEVCEVRDGRLVEADPSKTSTLASVSARITFLAWAEVTWASSNRTPTSAEVR